MTSADEVALCTKLRDSLQADEAYYVYYTEENQ